MPGYPTRKFVFGLPDTRTNALIFSTSRTYPSTMQVGADRRSGPAVVMFRSALRALHAETPIKATMLIFTANVDGTKKNVICSAN